MAAPRTDCFKSNFCLSCRDIYDFNPRDVHTTEFPIPSFVRFRHVLFWELAVASCSSGPQAGGTPDSLKLSRKISMKDGMGTFVHTYRVHQKPPTFRLYSHVVYRLGPNLTFMAHPSPVPEQSSSWLINRDGPGRGGLHCSGLNKFFLGKNS